MKLVTIDSREVAGRPAVLLGNGDILDLAAAPRTLAQSQWVPQSVVSILAAGDHGRERIDDLLTALQNAGEDELRGLRDARAILPVAGTALMAPIRRPGLILIVSPDGESGNGPLPISFIKSPNSAVGPDTEVSVPWPEEHGLTGCGMLGVVLGKPIYRDTRQAVDDAIAGYTLLIDLSRPGPGPDLSAAAWRQFIDSKQFPGACPMGPAILTREEVDDPAELTAISRVNGTESVAATLIDEDVDIAGTITELATQGGFRPGDVVAFATADSVHLAPLRNRDQMSVELCGQMELRVTVKF